MIACLRITAVSRLSANFPTIEDSVEQLIVSHVRQALGVTNETNPTDPSMLRGTTENIRKRHLGGRSPWRIFPFLVLPTFMRGDSGNGASQPRFPAAQGTKETQIGCAWSATVTAATYNLAFPDLNCVYQVLLYWGITEKTTLRIDGQFPHVRYFSYQSYDLVSGEPIASLIDYEIEPSKGVNPFHESPQNSRVWGTELEQGFESKRRNIWNRYSSEENGGYQDRSHNQGKEMRYMGPRVESSLLDSENNNAYTDAWSPNEPPDKHTSNAGHFGSDSGEEIFGSYQVHITDTGLHGFPNELATSSSSAGRFRYQQCGGKGCLALVILRLYTAEPGEDAFRHHHPRRYSAKSNDYSRLWGYVPPPKVSVRYGERINEWTGWSVPARYKELDQCQEDRSTVVRSFLDWKIPQLKRDWEGQSSLDNVDDNFIVYTPSTSSRALFSNADASYLFATAKNNRSVSIGDQSSGPQRKELVTRITGHLPTVPHGFMETNYDDDMPRNHENYHRSYEKEHTYRAIADIDSYEARYVSLSTIALKGAGPVVDTLMDTVIEQKYRKQEGWEQTRYFSVVAAPGTGLLSRCPPRVYQQDRDLFLNTVPPGQSEPPAHMAFLYRQILSQWQTRGRVDKSIARAKHECLGRNDGGHACKLRSFFINMMGSRYPSIKYFYCWENVTRGCSCEDSQGILVTWEDIGEGDQQWRDWALPDYFHHSHQSTWGEDDNAGVNADLMQSHNIQDRNKRRGTIPAVTSVSTPLNVSNAENVTRTASSTSTKLLLNASALFVRASPYSWNQTQAYYYYMQQTQENRPLVKTQNRDNETFMSYQDSMAPERYSLATERNSSIRNNEQ